MELQIHTEAALKIIELGQMSQEEMMQYQRDHSNDIVASAKAIIGLYAGELITAAEETNVLLDLTYETIKNIPAALMMLYHKQHKWGYEEQRNKIITCRTLAAYIDLLVINTFDNCRIGANTYSNKRNETKPELWADHIALRLDNKKNSDMLPYVWEGANRAPIEVDNGFMIDITPLVEGYLRLTGDNLADEGLPNMVLSYGE